MLEGVIDSRDNPRPRRVMLHGIHGIGKSTFGACAPNPIFVPTEDGQRDLRVKMFPVAKSYGEFMENLNKVAMDRHEFETVVIDSADWLEALIHRQVCADGNKEKLSDFAYGKGYEAALVYWRYVLGLLEACGQRSVIGLGPDMLVIIIAHTRVRKVEDPMTDPYDKFEPALQRSNSGGPSSSLLLQEWVDEILFARQRVVTVKGEDKNETIRGHSSGERLLFTTDRPSHVAKNHLSLPPELPLAFSAYWEAVQKAQSALDAEVPV